MLLFAHVGLTLFLGRRLRNVDLVFLALGSMLPDIIDKPLGIVIFGSAGMGRTFAHTALFLCMVAAMALYLKEMRSASLCLGVLTHLVLDSMWASPAILFWPLLGPFPAATPMDVMSYLELLISNLRDPWVSLPEAFGFMYSLYFASRSAWPGIAYILMPSGER